MKILKVIPLFLFCNKAYSEYQNGQSYYLQEQLAREGSSGYISSEEREVQPRTAIEVYELSAYRRNREEVPQQPVAVPAGYAYQGQYQVQQQYQPVVQQVPSRGILTQSPLVQQQYYQPAPVQTQAYQQPIQQPVVQQVQAPVATRGILSNTQPAPQQYQQQVYTPQQYTPQPTNLMAQQPPAPTPTMEPQKQPSLMQNYTQRVKDKTQSVTQNVSRQSGLFGYKKYYAMNLGHPFKSTYKFTEDSTSESISQNGFVPIAKKNGILGFYIGKRMERLSAVRYEYGVQWEILSFQQKVVQGTTETTYDVFNHNVGASFRGFFDIPLSRSAFFSLGLEGNYGAVSHIVADSQSFSISPSYAFLTGLTMQISKRRSMYVLLRQGAIPNKKYDVMNSTRTASFSSTSIIIGLHVISQ